MIIHRTILLDFNQTSCAKCVAGLVKHKHSAFFQSGRTTGTVWDNITPTQPMREGTQISLSFNININGQEFWVAPNGT